MIKKHKYRLQILQQLRPYAKGIEGLFWGKLLCGLVLLVTAMLTPVLYSVFIEDVILGGKTQKIGIVIVGYIVIQLVTAGILHIKNYCTYTLNNQISRTMRLKILDTKLKLDFDSYKDINVGNEKMLFDEAVFQLLDFTGVQSVDNLINIGKTIIFFVILFFIEWRLAAIMMLMIPISFWLNDRNAVHSKKNNEEMWQNNQSWGNWIYKSGASWREIRALNMEKRCEDIFNDYSNKYHSIFRRNTELWVTRHFIIPKVKDEFLMQFLLYFLGGLSVFYGHISIGNLLIFGQYYLQLMESLRAVVDADNNLEINSVVYNRAIEAANMETPEFLENGVEIENYRIKLDNISFRYNEESPYILKDFSLTIEPGERIGIVGESGKGKSTLLHLIAGILKPNEGEISFGDHPLSELQIEKVHRKIGFVLQENTIFNASIKENMLYAKADATDGEIIAACKKAFISDFIDSLPEGYDTIVGEKGIKLSGGQRQRLVLARLFLQDVSVFILDEATSALDQRAESIIQDALSCIGEDKTIIIVSHRDNSLKICQRIIYL